MAALPVIGITMGDPLGIGPEVVVKALADPAIRKLASYVVYGRNEVLLAAAEKARVGTDWFRVDAGSERAQRGSAVQACERRTGLPTTTIRQVDEQA